MTELVTVEQAEHVLRWLALVLPAAGLVTAVAVGAVRGRRARAAPAAFLAGLVGPASWLLWRLYGAIVDHFGLDSVAGLLVSLLVFAALGAVVGLAVGRWLGSSRRTDSAQSTSTGRS